MGVCFHGNGVAMQPSFGVFMIGIWSYAPFLNIKNIGDYAWWTSNMYISVWMPTENGT